MVSNRDTDQLVQRVTALVLARLGEPTQPGRVARRRRVELLLPVQTVHIDVVTAATERLGRLGYPLVVRTTARVRAWLERTGRLGLLGSKVHALDEACLCESLGDFSPRDLVVLGSLGFSSAERILALVDDDPFARLIAQALLRGLAVLALADDLTAAPAVEGPVVERAERALLDLERLGIELLSGAELVDRVERFNAADTTLSQAAAGLLTEAEVVELVAGGQRRLVLDQRTIVTPLARSRAAELGFELIETGR